MSKTKRTWDRRRVRALREHMGLSQDALAAELGTRQQTVSEWETGQYEPRGASARLLSVVAERAGFAYEAKSEQWLDSGQPTVDSGQQAESSELNASDR